MFPQFERNFMFYHCQKLNDLELFKARKVRSVKCGNWFFCSVDVALFGFQNESICLLKDGPTCYWSIPMYNYNNVMCNALYVMSTISSFFTQFLMMQVSSSATQYIASTVSVPYYWRNDHTYAETWQTVV